MSFRATLKLIRRLASRSLSRFWRSGFLVLGFVRRAFPDNRIRISPPPLSSPVVVISPHPDDEAIACSGAISRHIDSGATVIVAIATDGRQSRQESSEDEMAAVRHAEATRSSQQLRIHQLVWLGLPEGRWQPVELEQSLVGLIRKFQPLIIYAPSRIDFHPEHLNVAGALSRALALVEAEIRDRIHVRVFQVQVPLGSVLANRVIDISGVVETADAALQEYRSQRGSIEFVYRRRDYDARARGMRGPVEAFWEISARQYIAVHAGDTAGWQGKFRGFRRFAWTDPLAYLQGQGERRRLRILADRFA